MRKIFSRLFIAALVMGTVSPAFADRWERKDDRKERREERRDERQDRHEDRKERREERQERREDRRDDRRDNNRWGGQTNNNNGRWGGQTHRRHAPPAMRQERWSRKPGHIWVSGHWDWRGNDYVWVGGRYERERRGYRWREARYEDRDGDYVLVDGGWMAVGPTAAPPPIRVERYDNRAGYLWVRGRWDWQGDNWAWVPGHYERERRGYRYREPRWEEQNGAWISVQGSWEVN